MQWSDSRECPHNLTKFSMTSITRKYLERLEAVLVAQYGLDLFQVFRAEAYNAFLASDHRYTHLPRLPTASNAAFTPAVLIGNYKAIWEPFKQYCQRTTDQLDNPLDTFVAESIHEALQSIDQCIKPTLFYPYETGPKFVHFQKVAHLSNMAHLHPDANLCVHPQYGAWMALRAVLVFDKYPVSNDLVNMFQQEPFSIQSPIPLDDPKVQEALCAFMNACKEKLPYSSTWKLLVNVRDAISAFQPAIQHRYTEEQIIYHYLKDRSVLK